MKNLSNTKKGLILGTTLIIIAILIGIIFNYLDKSELADLGFIFAGVGVIIIGITILAHLNKKPIQDDK